MSHTIFSEEYIKRKFKEVQKLNDKKMKIINQKKQNAKKMTEKQYQKIKSILFSSPTKSQKSLQQQQQQQQQQYQEQQYQQQQYDYRQSPETYQDRQVNQFGINSNSATKNQNQKYQESSPQNQNYPDIFYGKIISKSQTRLHQDPNVNPYLINNQQLQSNYINQNQYSLSSSSSSKNKNSSNPDKNIGSNISQNLTKQFDIRVHPDSPGILQEIISQQISPQDPRYIQVQQLLNDFNKGPEQFQSHQQTTYSPQQIHGFNEQSNFISQKMLQLHELINNPFTYDDQEKELDKLKSQELILNDQKKKIELDLIILEKRSKIVQNKEKRQTHKQDTFSKPNACLQEGKYSDEQFRALTEANQELELDANYYPQSRYEELKYQLLGEFKTKFRDPLVEKQKLLDFELQWQNIESVNQQPKSTLKNKTNKALELEAKLYSKNTSNLLCKGSSSSKQRQPFTKNQIDQLSEEIDQLVEMQKNNLTNKAQSNRYQLDNDYTSQIQQLSTIKEEHQSLEFSV